MLNYELKTTDSWYPQLLIDYTNIKFYKQDIMLNEEINKIWNVNSLKEIINNLIEVESWKLNEYSFWFGYTFIECYNKWKSYYWEKYPNSNVCISYDYGTKSIPTNFTIKEVIKMMKDFRNFIIKWEQKIRN